MKSIDVIYKFGHIYDRITKERILIEDNAEFSIVLNPNDLLKEDPSISKKEKPLNKKEKVKSN